MNHDILDATSYAWRTTCLNRPAYEVKHDDAKILGKVTAVDYTSDKDHSSACFYVNLNPEGSKWINLIKKKIDMDEVTQRLAFNSHYGMYVEERPKFDLKQYWQSIYLKNGEETNMSIVENEYLAKKRFLEVEQEAKENELKVKYNNDLIELRKEFGQRFCDLDKEKETAEQKEKAEVHAKAVKEAYDAYIRQGFTEKQADNFIKIALENQSS